MNGKKMKLTTNEEVKEVLSHLTSKDFKVDQVDKKERKRNAPPTLYDFNHADGCC